MTEVLTTQERLDDIDNHTNSIFVLHEKTERRFPVHKHTKGQLTYVEGGIAYVHVAGKIYVIPARHYIWVPSGLPHFLQVRHSATAIRNLYFPVDDDAPAFYRNMGIYPVNSLLHEMLLYTERFKGAILPSDSCFPFLTAIRSILPELSENHLQTALPVSDNQRLRPVLRYLDEHFAKVITARGLAEQFAMSERTLSRLFQTELSISFLQYLKQLRMVKAVEMILQTEITLSEIAYATGYQSLSAFSNTFQQFTNLRPSQFAQSVR
jgi:AraC-like DNA-binding protein/quercetin dioxygenase-like cupin family protein